MVCYTSGSHCPAPWAGQQKTNNSPSYDVCQQKTKLIMKNRTHTYCDFILLQTVNAKKDASLQNASRIFAVEGRHPPPKK